jgi:hypothetical protein
MAHKVPSSRESVLIALIVVGMELIVVGMDDFF